MTAQDIKDFCKEQGLTYKELAELIGMTEGGLKNTFTTEKVSAQTEKSIELLKENLRLKKKLQDLEQLKILLNNFLTSK